MAINVQKLLPSSETSIIKIDNNSEQSKSSKKSEKKKFSPLLKELLIIKKTTSTIEKSLKNNFSLQKKNNDIFRKTLEKSRFSQKEQKMEDGGEDKKVKPEKSLVPRIGIFDRINRFIFFTFVGWLTKKFFKYLPQLLDFSKKILPVIKFFETLAGNIFNGLVDFIDFGYDAYDKVREFTKNLGGENLQKTFDQFTANLNKFVNIAIIAGIAASGGSDFGVGKRGAKPTSRSIPTKSKISDYFSRNSQTKFIEKKYGNNAARMYEARKSQGASNKRALADVKKRFDPLKYQGGLKGGIGKGKVFQRGLKNVGSRFATKVLGKTGKRVAGKVFGKIPIIGGLVDFLFALWSGEPIGRAAAKAVGATIGSALGTFIPIPFAGTILGGILGDIVGGALYDTLIGNRPKKPEVRGKARGGQISTRGGKKVGGKIRRTIKKRVSIPKPLPVKPGESVGGEKNVKKIFPEPAGTQLGKVVNPYEFMKDTTNNLLKTEIAGALSAPFIKPFLGDMPSKTDYKNFGLAINAWINNAISKGTLSDNAMKGFAGGGIIDSNMRRDISEWAEKSLEDMIKNKVTKAINDLRKNLGLEPLQQNIRGNDVTDGMGGDLGSASDAVGGARILMSAGFPMLAAAILSGNIQQESGWNGQRTPWVLNDGAGINKGLISWNRTRITNAEKFLGKPLETASNAEQVKWIKEELRQYGLLDDFMNPQATETQLKEASYKYIGWGDLGDRWKYSRNIFNALQKGEQGTYTPPITKSTRGPSGPLKDTGLKDSQGRSIKLVSPAAESFINMSKDAQKQGINLGSGISNALRSPEHNRMVGGASGSRHLTGEAFDINWYSAAGIWIRNNASKYGFRYNSYSPQSTHFDWVGKEGGGVVSLDSRIKNTKPLEYEPEYSQDYIIAVQPIIEKVMVPVPVSSGNIMSTVFSGDLNSNMNSSMFIS